MADRSAVAEVEVGVDPATAFRAFTEEIGHWWVPSPINMWDFARAQGRRIEPGVGGRVLEVYADGVLELGRVTVWEPGSRLVYRSSVDETEVDVRFEAAGDGTRVRVEHSVLPGGNVDPSALFWPRIIHWLQNWCEVRDSAPPRRVLARLAAGLDYADPPAAARWLAEVFGLRSWDRIPAPGDRPGWIELHAGDVAILLFGTRAAEGKPAAHSTWIYVDDLEAHFGHAKAAGATILEEITEHGFRSYTAEDLEGHRWTFVQASPDQVARQAGAAKVTGLA